MSDSILSHLALLYDHELTRREQLTAGLSLPLALVAGLIFGIGVLLRFADAELLHADPLAKGAFVWGVTISIICAGLSLLILLVTALMDRLKVQVTPRNIFENREDLRRGGWQGFDEISADYMAVVLTSEIDLLRAWNESRVRARIRSMGLAVTAFLVLLICMLVSLHLDWYVDSARIG